MGRREEFLRGAFARYIIFAVVVLALLPVIGSFFAEGASFIIRLKTIMSLYRFNLMIVASTGLFLFLSSKKLAKHEWKTRISEMIIFLILGIALFTASIAPYSSMNKYFSAGVYVENSENSKQFNQIFLDREKWLNLWIIESKDNTEYIFMDGMDSENSRLKKEIEIEKVPESPKIMWLGSWKGPLFNDQSFNPEFNVFMSVNREAYNITSQYRQLSEGENGWLELNITPENLQAGKNKIEIYTTNNYGIGEDIGVGTFSIFQNNSSLIKTGEEWNHTKGQFLIFIQEENSFAYNAAFKTAFLARLLAALLIFIAIFGTGFVHATVQNAKNELLFSTIWLYIIGVFYLFTTQISSFLEQLTSFGVFILLRLISMPVSAALSPYENIVGVAEKQTMISESVSGGIYMTFFLLIFAILIYVNWGDFNPKKIVKYHIIGLASIFLLNIVNLFIIYLIDYKKPGIGIAISEYVSEALIIVFFIIFWPIVMKEAAKNGKK